MPLKIFFQLLSSIASSVILRRGSRKVLFVVSISAVILSCLSIATMSFLKNNKVSDQIDNLGWLPLLFVITTFSAYSIGVNPIQQVLVGELFPTDIRSLGIGITLSVARCVEAINALAYPFLIDQMNLYGTFFFYTGTTLAAMLWGLFTIPDNRGLSLAKIEENSLQTPMKLVDSAKVIY